MTSTGTKLEFAQLDISSQASIHALSVAMKEKHATVDILINNAGVAMKGFDANVVKTTLATNYDGTKHVRLTRREATARADTRTQMCEQFLPLLHPDHGRVVNVSSTLGKLGTLGSNLAARFRAANTVADVDALMAEFARDVEQGVHTAKGWPSAAYAVSKMGVIGLTRALSSQHRGNVLINACCPGWVKTDMTGRAGMLTPKQGAQTPVFLTLADVGGKTGVFWANKQESAW